MRRIPRGLARLPNKEGTLFPGERQARDVVQCDTIKSLRLGFNSVKLLSFLMRCPNPSIELHDGHFCLEWLMCG